MRVLILGGTAWLGRRIASEHVAAGHEVTCLARGDGVAGFVDGTVAVPADRDDGDAAFAGLTGTWDEVVDVTRIPAHAAAAVDALGASARHWTFVSTVSVYAPPFVAGADTSAPLVAPSDDPDDYAGAKVACEAAARRALGDRLLVVRPGLVAGPGDPTDRWGSWVERAALAGDGPLLAPARDRPAQVIDVRDLAAAVVELGTRQAIGTIDAVGARSTIAAHIDAAREAAGHVGRVIDASDEELVALGIGYWAGQRSLALWLPETDAAMADRADGDLAALGIARRPLAETASDVLADERARGLERPRASGLERADEVRAIATILTSRTAAPADDAESARPDSARPDPAPPDAARPDEERP